jgi:hypothetical protein
VANDTEFSFVAASVRRAVRLQRDYVHAFLETADRERRSIGEHFDELCTVFDGFVDAYEREFAATTDPVHRTVVLNAARELLEWARDLQERRAWLDAAVNPPIDLGSFYYLSGLARAIVRGDSELTIVAKHEGSYATVINPFRRPAYPVPPDIVLVSFLPHREVRSGLLHPLLVHELGHGAARVHNHPETLRAGLTPGAIDDLFEEGAKQQALQSGQTEHDERQALDKRFPAWIEEVFCDAIGSACLGPTYLFSFATEVLPADVDAAAPRHPPSRQRVRLIIEHLDRLGWTSVLDRDTPDFVQWVRGVASANPAPQPPSDEALRGAIDIGGRQIQDAAEARAGTRVLRPDDATLSAVTDLLDEHVPPAQVENGAAIDCPTIIVGCWLSALKSRGGGVSGLTEAVDSPELAQLLPYALELSILVDRWQTA